MTSKIAYSILISTIIGLTACQKEEAVSQSSTASTPTVSEAQTLVSRDGKVSITVPAGHFADISTNSAEKPEGLSEDEITLLEKDDNTDITLYVANLGEAKTKPETYFQNLSAALKADKSLENVQTGAATSNRMNYRFRSGEGDHILKENCIAIYEDNQLYNVCANSPTASQEELASVLKDVTLNK